MDLALIIYLIGVFGTVKTIGIISMLALGVATCFVFVGYCVEDDREVAKTTLKMIPAKSLAVCALLTMLCPSEGAAYKILAAYGIESVVASDSAQRLAPKSLELLELTIDKQLKGLKGEL